MAPLVEHSLDSKKQNALVANQDQTIILQKAYQITVN